MVKKRKSKFWKIFSLVFLILIILLIVILLILNTKLKEYEQSQPEYYAEEIFEDTYKSGDVDKIVDISKKTFSEFQPLDQINSNLEDKINGKEITYSKAYGSNLESSTITYYVKADDEIFASFSLKPTNEKKLLFLFTYSNYVVNSYDLILDNATNIEIMVPLNYSLSVNNISVDDSYITEKEINKNDVITDIPEDVTTLKYNKYEIPNIIGTPDIKGTDSKGTETSSTFDSQTNFYYLDVIFSQELKDSFNDYAIEAAEALAKYMQGDNSFNNVSQYFDESTNLYTDIKNNLNFVWDHNGYDFEDVTAKDFLMYEDNSFSCIVKLKQILHMTGKEDYEEYIDRTFYFRNVNGTYLIYYTITNS